MAAVRRYRFQAQVMLDLAAYEGLARGFSSPTRPSGTHSCCLVEPFYHRYFPAVISRDEGMPLRPWVRAVMTVVLTDGEAEAFFAPGQRFTIWSDAVVGHTICADGPAGHGIISRPSARAA
jgi:hypothetical protein